MLDPDEEIQQAVRLLFACFEQTGSALAVVKHFARHKLRFPTRGWGKGGEEEVVWRPLSHARALYVLHDPAYAGTYVYGRTTTRSRTLPGEAPRIKGRTRRVKRADWPIVHHDHHPAYIGWAQFLRNEQQLDDNRTLRDEDRRGVRREGAALLQGIVLCGHCGRRMTIRCLSRVRSPPTSATRCTNSAAVRPANPPVAMASIGRWPTPCWRP